MARPPGPGGGGPRRRLKRKPKKKVKRFPIDPGRHPRPTNPGAPTTTTTSTTTTGLPPSAAGQLAQDAGQLEQEQAAADAYEAQQAMVTTPTTQAPANAYQDQAEDRSNDALASFFSTGSGEAQEYRPGQSYAYEVAAGTGAENNPT